MAVASILSKSALRALPYIERGVREGLSANKIQALLTSKNLGVNRQALQQAVRYVATVQDAAKAYGRFAKNRLIDESLHTDAKTIIRRQYSYRIKATITFEEGGQEYDHHITVSTNDRLSPDELEAISESIIMNNKDYEVFAIRGMGVEAMLRAGPGGLL